jgi:hypothetical protein
VVRMTITLLTLSVGLLSLSAIAQNNNESLAGSPGCGDSASRFDVKTIKEKPPSQPESGKALVYFIEDDSTFNSTPKPTTRAGIDGNWVGATHGNSFLYFSVEPGVHHLCASWQSGSHPLASALLGVATGMDSQAAASSFTAEAGGVYYFVAKNIFVRKESSTTKKVDLIPLNNDEGQLLANGLSLSISAKKQN